MSWLNAGVFAAILCALQACTGDPSPRGEPCTSDAECGELVCRADVDAQAEDLAPLALTCGDASDAASAGEACERAAECDNGICLLAGACARACTDDAECDGDQRCQAVFARVGDDALQSVSTCVARVDLPADATVTSEVRQHAIEKGDNTLELEPPEPRGQTLYVLEHSRDAWPSGMVCRTPLCIRSLHERTAQPRLLFDADADYATDHPIVPVAFGEHINPLVIAPNGLHGPAGFSARVLAEQTGDLRVTRIASDASGHRLDLNVFYLGALDWEPTGTRGPELLADALDVVDEILGQAEIEIGEVRQIAVPGELPERGLAFPKGDQSQGFAVLEVRFGVYPELPGLFRLSAGAANSAINLFFVQDIAARDDDGELEAEAGGIPGPIGMHGTSGSGIAIATDMMDGDPMRLGRTLAHEIGHYLGLFHTSESDGSVLDPIADTPECRADRDADEDGLSVTDCEGAGADNLMFWARTTGTTLSATQRAVLRSAPILR